jgi:pimeloyl-ACP methyl ester carboxylesterase
MQAITEHTEEIGGQEVFWRASGDSASPVLYVHGVPTSGADWKSFLAQTGGLAPDLPGFGHSAKRADGEYTMEFFAHFVEQFLAHLRIDRVLLVVHEWGWVGLIWAQRFPERVERLVVIDAVPLLPGYRWHKVARLWRTRGAGELAMGAMSRRALKQSTREAAGDAGVMPDEWLDETIATFDQGTQRAILRLYRSSPPARLAAAGAQLGAIRCPAFVVWGEREPYIPPRFAAAYAEALGGPAEHEVLAGAGHWPWIQRPDLVGRIATFLDGGAPTAAAGT